MVTHLPTPNLAPKRFFTQTAIPLARTRFSRFNPTPKPPQPVSKNPRLPTQLTHHSNKLRITPPIPPSTANITTPENHPLWQFFSDRRFIRSSDELDTAARPWTVPELRRKSFNDLHSLWYTCLKERNILAREIHLLEFGINSDTGIYRELSEKVRTTMWRIRHVLSERDWAFRLSKEMFNENDAKARDKDKINDPQANLVKQKFLQEFSEEWLSDEFAVDSKETWEMLSRFQLAVFGINEVIEDNVVDRTWVDGLKFIANLKLKKFDLQSTLGGEITDAGEAFVLFTAENTEGATREACDIVKELRDNGRSVSRYDEIETITDYVNQLMNVTPAEEAE